MAENVSDDAGVLQPGGSEEPTAYLCTMAEHERIVEVVYLNAGQLVPCEVQYQKDGQTEVLWRANNKQGYCERKARWFLKKLHRLGWTCTPLKLLTWHDQPGTDELS
ncbi:hypothetical protein FE236_09545 [Mariprofundus erugo]|uniref:hypothetical protein n=1 Tax=Mariprofundus erugo TaxID=2528639 RepID=UPI0010FECE5F|nr:hypothetical protein [Mariprofundus erugo]TLS75327.1 hypothetical protein FE236_09545 [Mariprofundus erugo]